MPTLTGPRLAAATILISALGGLGCQNDYGTDGCTVDDAPVVPDFHAGAGVTDVTFLAFGDSQVFLDAGLGADDGGAKNERHVVGLNAAGTLRWDALGLDEPVTDIRGVLMAGDITQNARDQRSAVFPCGLFQGGDVGPCNEYGEFVERYGLCGNRELRYPVYEGYGNHDYSEDADLLYRPGEHTVADSVAVRNDFRPGIVRTAPGTDGHYSWDWDGLRFVNLNLAPSDVDPQLDNPGKRDPRAALSYLRSELAAVGPEQRVVLMMHYGPGSATFEWTSSQIADFASAIDGYEVIAIVHGHAHSTSTYTWNGIPVFNVGSPYYQTVNPDRRGHFSVLRITDDRIYAFDASWDPNDPGSVQGPVLWSRVVELG